MTKTEAINLLGGTVPAAARAIGCTYQAVDKWPEQLPPRIADRVQAALWRQSQAKRRRRQPVAA
jgi:transcriptional repressor of cell division inhibition gene dicB